MVTRCSTRQISPTTWAISRRSRPTSAPQRHANLTAVQHTLWTAAAANRVDDIINTIADRQRKRERLGFESRAALAAVEAPRLASQHPESGAHPRQPAKRDHHLVPAASHLEFDQEPEGAKQAYTKAIDAHEAAEKLEAAEAAKAPKKSGVIVHSEAPPVATAPITLAKARLEVLNAPVEDIPVF